MGIGTAISNTCRAFAHWVETASWGAQKSADGARSSTAILDHIPEEVEASGQRVISAADEAISTFEEMRAKAERLQSRVDYLTKMAERDAEKAKGLPEGSPERVRLEQVVRDWLGQMVQARNMLTPIQQSLEKSAAGHAQALAAVDRTGISKQQALSTRDALRIQDASAEAQLRLAKARQAMADDGSLGEMFREAEAKIDAKIGRARAAEQIANAIPRSAQDIEAGLAVDGMHAAVDDEFTRLMGPSSAPAAPATAA